MAAPDDFDAWFRLLQTPGLGREGARRLLAAFGSPEAVLAASPVALTELGGPALAATMARPAPECEARLAAARAWLAGETLRHAITLGDPAYPPLLLQTADPPLLLYVQGRTELLAAESVAIVGSREATPQGLANAREFARGLGEAGLTIVSGLAAGIDGAAHEGALAAGAATVAVVGTGPDRVYPARHKALARRIAETGAIVSEYDPGTPVLPEHFPQRNRIIAALARGTLVVEAAPRSGSLITARLAAEAGREVFAVPGSIHSPQSRGCHALIRQGAMLVEGVDDVLEVLRGTRPAAALSAVPDADTPADPVLAALGHEPATLDALLARTGWPTAELSARLLELELDGQLARLPGGLFQRRVAG
ncbi:DNA-processing protein DprA [Rubrivivax benzoatilyticus]|uniref:DNA-protecting protein DprA n=1 Tax=Rubrivivax benzoatilyticus TaxID=316997 RepID=A0ABX0I0L3_9BURK|nr:DNA-processing protein DprA [Rubrivivax benzoatilyticus]EGJ09899.1 putative SMF protein [Rubrivivax benzoatilyticus JA2 = ATCC BAA-35]NHK99386.1 DNA-protecting protein DprA [Rubrivivax benzoatilyticus]NHL25260.1 DNA-protecting protein DprA [Rubrivivax benzoatilyticus]